MNYYGFGKGMTLNSNSPMFDPTAPGAFAAAPQGEIPYAGGFTSSGPGGMSLTSSPAAPASFAERLLSGAETPDKKGTPFAGITEGAGDIAKG